MKLKYIILFAVICLNQSAILAQNIQEKDSVCIKCEEQIKNAIENWDSVIANNKDVYIISFKMVATLDNDKQRRKAVKRITNDNTYVPLYYGVPPSHDAANQADSIKFVKQKEVWGKIIEEEGKQYARRTRFQTKEQRIKFYSEEVLSNRYLYEIVIKYHQKVITLPALCNTAGYISNALITTSNFFAFYEKSRIKNE
jgi:hypothetical protein